MLHVERAAFVKFHKSEMPIPRLAICTQDSETRSHGENPFKNHRKATDFDGEKFMIQVRLLAAWKNLVHINNRMAKCHFTFR